MWCNQFMSRSTTATSMALSAADKNSMLGPPPSELTGANDGILGLTEEGRASRQVKPAYIPTCGSAMHSSFVDDEVKPATKGNKFLFGLKWAVIIVLVVVGGVVATISCLYSRSYEQTRFEERFQDDATRFVTAFYQRQAVKLRASIAIAVALIAEENYHDGISWPNVTLPEYEAQTMGHLQTSLSDSFAWAPLLRGPEQRESWESYAVEHQELAGIKGSNFYHNRTVEDCIFRRDKNSNIVDDDVSLNVSLPIWQVSPSEAKSHLHMFDLYSVEAMRKQIFVALDSQLPQISDVLDDQTADFFLGTRQHSLPRTLLLTPVSNTLDGQHVVGIVVAEVDWM